MRAAVEIAGSVTTPVHGCPHRSNVVSAHGGARFIDFETITRGPVEWDLAHLEPEVAVAYPTHVDTGCSNGAASP
jgi:thiamine kinase-like enzyme